MKVLRSILDKTVIGALFYALTCRLGNDRPPVSPAKLASDVMAGTNRHKD